MREKFYSMILYLARMSPKKNVSHSTIIENLDEKCCEKEVSLYAFKPHKVGQVSCLYCTGKMPVLLDF
jgi:hypothetical protein